VTIKGPNPQGEKKVPAHKAKQRSGFIEIRAIDEAGRAHGRRI